jgi:hypothetical protein
MPPAGGSFCIPHRISESCRPCRTTSKAGGVRGVGAQGTKKGEPTGRRCQQGQICGTQRSTTLVGRLALSSDVSLPTQMANWSFAVPLPFPPACAIGTQPLPARRECLECSRVGQADRTPTLHAGNLHGILSRPPKLREGPRSFPQIARGLTRGFEHRGGMRAPTSRGNGRRTNAVLCQYLFVRFRTENGNVPNLWKALSRPATGRPGPAPSGHALPESASFKVQGRRRFDSAVTVRGAT